ncbi:MAG TPA: urease accessory UreF family protein [Beijerinckiaceae bacterium]|jgi:urease accessory protein
MSGAHLPLMVWLSPAFPVGAFAYSHGLEWAHEAGDVADAAGLEGWLSDLLGHGAARNDAILFASAWRAAAAGNGAALAEVAELALALAGSEERRLESTTQGDAFAAAIARSWPCGGIGLLKEAWPGPLAYPVAVAAAAAGHAIPLPEALEAFVLGFTANLVSAAVRLGIVGQTDGQRVIAALVPQVRELAAAARDAGLDDLGSCAFRSDLAAMRHETQYTRLFRS